MLLLLLLYNVVVKADVAVLSVSLKENVDDSGTLNAGDDVVDDVVVDDEAVRISVVVFVVNDNDGNNDDEDDVKEDVDNNEASLAAFVKTLCIAGDCVNSVKESFVVGSAKVVAYTDVLASSVS